MRLVENNRQYLGDFIRLNEAWISRYFAIEEVDRALAANPGKIIDKGGTIFCLLNDETVVGACALFNEGNGVFELARMAVDAEHQGKGFGDILIQACLAKLNAIGAQRVYLVSNTKLQAAIALYKKHGFVTISEGPHPIYSRANITMERRLL